MTVVTVGAEGTLHGMTASSFASVSLEPPLILVCLDKASRTLSLLLKTKTFAVNVLSSDQEDIARMFATTGDKTFERWPHVVGTAGAPLLEGCIAWIECELERSEDAGDHEIVIGRVQECRTAEGLPLIYFDRTYRDLR